MKCKLLTLKGPSCYDSTYKTADSWAELQINSRPTPGGKAWKSTRGFDQVTQRSLKPESFTIGRPANNSLLLHQKLPGLPPFQSVLSILTTDSPWPTCAWQRGPAQRKTLGFSAQVTLWHRVPLSLVFGDLYNTHIKGDSAL